MITTMKAKDNVNGSKSVLSIVMIETRRRRIRDLKIGILQREDVRHGSKGVRHESNPVVFSEKEQQVEMHHLTWQEPVHNGVLPCAPVALSPQCLTMIDRPSLHRAKPCDCLQN